MHFWGAFWTLFLGGLGFSSNPVLPVNAVQVLGPWVAVVLALTVLAVEILFVRRKKNPR